MIIDATRIAGMVNELRVLVDQIRSDVSLPAISDQEMENMLQRSLNKFFYEMVEQGEDYFVKTQSFTIQDGQRIVLPSDFYKDILVGFQTNTDEDLQRLEKVSLNQLYLETAGGYYEYLPDRGTTRKRYILESLADMDQLIIVPERQNGGIYQVKYIPESPNLEGFKLPRGIEDYFIYDSAIDAAGSNYSDSMEWKQKRDDLELKIIGWLSNRSANYPNRVKRVSDDPTVDDNYFVNTL